MTDEERKKKAQAIAKSGSWTKRRDLLNLMKGEQEKQEDTVRETPIRRGKETETTEHRQGREYDEGRERLRKRDEGWEKERRATIERDAREVEEAREVKERSRLEQLQAEKAKRQQEKLRMAAKKVGI